MLISIILPIYNMEKYLSRCMDSIFAQTYQKLQIIMVDDGSVDHTPSMCDSYQNRDSRVEVVHKENGGLSSARNAGMQLAKGEYIFFFDPDDTIPVDAIEKLVNVAGKHQYDIIKGLHYVNQNEKRRLTGYTWDEGCVARGGSVAEKERWRRMKTSWSFGCAWAGMYRREFLEKNKIQFDDNRVIFLEDVLFNAKLFALKPQYYMLCEPVYEYFYVEGSLLNRYTPDMSGKLRALLTEYEQYLSGKGLLNENLDLLVTLTARYFSWTSFETAKEKKSNWKELYRDIKVFGEDETVKKILHISTAMSYLNNLDRWMDTVFYSVCMILLKYQCYHMLTVLFGTLRFAMTLYAAKRTRV